MREIFLCCVFFFSCNAFSDVVVNLSKIKDGQYEIVNWQNLPIIVFHRTENQIKHLKLNIERPVIPASPMVYERLYGPSIAGALKQGDDMNKSHLRSLDEKWLIVIGFAPESGVALRVYGSKGVLMDPTDGTVYDLTGRVVDKSSNKKDLSVPEYKLSAQTLTIFTKPDQIDYVKNIVNPKDSPEKQVIDLLTGKEFKWAKTLINSHPTVVNNSKVNTAVLAVATIYGDKELLEIAIKHGAKINILLGNNSTPLNTALISDHMDIAEYLIKNGASIHKLCDPKNVDRCSTPTLEVARMIEGTEAIVKKWIREQEIKEIKK